LLADVSAFQKRFLRLAPDFALPLQEVTCSNGVGMSRSVSGCGLPFETFYVFFTGLAVSSMPLASDCKEKVYASHGLTRLRACADSLLECHKEKARAKTKATADSSASMGMTNRER
jgi:hypothetical protein